VFVVAIAMATVMAPVLVMAPVVVPVPTGAVVIVVADGPAVLFWPGGSV